MSRHTSSVLTAVLLLVGIPSLCESSGNGDAKIAAHIQSHPAKSPTPICERGDLPACNEGEGTLTINASTLAAYDVYFLVLDGDSTDGVAGASFGIDYNGGLFSGVDVKQWYLCADLEFETSWPDSGAGNRITWDSSNNCQRTPAVGDSSGNVTTILGVVYIYAYSQDVLSLTRNHERDEFEILSCSPGIAAKDDLPPKNLGKVSFGSAGGEYDPCKGPLSPYSVFEEMSSVELGTAEVKFTYGIPFSSGLASAIITPTGHTPDIAEYRYYRRWAFDYVSDRNAIVYPVSVTEIEQLIDDVSSLSGVTAGDVGEGAGALSFSLLNVVDDTTYVFESLVSPADASSLFAASIGALQDADAKAKLSLMACLLGASPPGVPTDVTDQVEIELQGFRLDHTTGLFVTNLKVTNISDSTLTAPLSLALNVGPSPVRIQEPLPAGVTCELNPPGRGYFDLPVGSGLAPSDSVEVVLKVGNPNRDVITVNPVLYSGSGSR
jgi:hypothetical protein